MRNCPLKRRQEPPCFAFALWISLTVSPTLALCPPFFPTAALKLRYQGEARLVALSREDFVGLLESFSTSFPSSPSTTLSQVTVTFVDPDGDIVTVKTDAEYHLALRTFTARGKMPSFDFVFPAGEAGAPSAAAAAAMQPLPTPAAASAATTSTAAAVPSSAAQPAPRAAQVELLSAGLKTAAAAAGLGMNILTALATEGQR